MVNHSFTERARHAGARILRDTALPSEPDLNVELGGFFAAIAGKGGGSLHPGTSDYRLVYKTNQMPY